MAISTIAEIEQFHNVHSGSPHITIFIIVRYSKHLTVKLIKEEQMF